MTLVAEAWGVPSSKRRGQKTESETAIELVASKTESRNGTRSLPWPLSPLHTSANFYYWLNAATGGIAARVAICL